MSTCLNPVRLVPGPMGPPGANGHNGTDGDNALSFLTAAFTMPAEGAALDATVDTNAWISPGQLVYLQNAGWLQATVLTGTTTVTLKNVEDSLAGTYADNVGGGTPVALASKLSPGGLQGPSGTNGSSGASAALTYITKVFDVSLPNSQGLSGLATGMVKVTTGTGALSTGADGTDYLSSATGLLKANNLSDVAVAATARTNLGLGNMAVQAAGAVAITGGTIVATSISGSTGSFTTLAASSDTTLSARLYQPPTAIQSLLAATAIAPNAGVLRVVGNGGAVTLTATPTISAPAADGQRLVIRGTDDANTVTLQSEATLAGTKLKIAAATRVLAKGDQIELLWDATAGFWYELAFANN